MDEMRDGSNVAGLNVPDAGALGADLLPRRRFPIELDVENFIEGVNDTHSPERSIRRWRAVRLAMVKSIAGRCFVVVVLMSKFEFTATL
jgi:hypothetical protein